jgi:hypothetical protein
MKVNRVTHMTRWRRRQDDSRTHLYPGWAWIYPGWVWKNSKIFRALSALTPGTLPRSAIEARSISFRVPK